jgi:hypothetical protein
MSGVKRCQIDFSQLIQTIKYKNIWFCTLTLREGLGKWPKCGPFSGGIEVENFVLYMKIMPLQISRVQVQTRCLFRCRQDAQIPVYLRKVDHLNILCTIQNHTRVNDAKYNLDVCRGDCGVILAGVPMLHPNCMSLGKSHETSQKYQNH